MSVKHIIKNNSDYKKTLLVIGVVHGDEPQGEFFIKEYLKFAEKKGKNRIIFIPRLNTNDKRTNINGVDLNRNFPTKNWILSDKNDYFGGIEPASEEETQFLVDMINSVKFDAVVTIHSPYKIINYDGACIRLAQKISSILGYPVQKDIGYPTPGSLGTYCGIERNISTVTIEVDEQIAKEKLLPKFFKLFNYLENDF